MTSGATVCTARDQLDAGVAALVDAGIATSRVDAEWLLADALGVSRGALALHLDRALMPAAVRRYEGAIRRRAAREPLQQVMGWEGFRGLRLAVTPDVLVPRPETEVLVEWALEALPPADVRSPTIVDVGTGSGCIACAIAHERADAHVIALDVSERAAARARDNAARLGFGDRVRVVVADLVSALAGRGADLVVANLPYLPAAVLASLEPEVRLHEPRIALDGGDDGLDVIRRLVTDVGRILRPGGALLLETAGGAQMAAAAPLLVQSGFVGVETRGDLAGVERFIAGRARRS